MGCLFFVGIPLKSKVTVYALLCFIIRLKGRYARREDALKKIIKNEGFFSLLASFDQIILWTTNCYKQITALLSCRTG